MAEPEVLRPDEPAPMAGLTLMAVFAHPDDEALACGGTLARAAAAGARVVLVCASRGELGSISDPALVSDGDLPRVRAAELEASARMLGIAEVILLSHEDGCLRWSETLDADIDAAIRRHRPDAVITFDADGLYWHGDHIGVHERTTSAVRALGPDAPALYYVTMPEGAMRAVVDAAHARGGPPPEKSLWGISPDAFGAAAPEPDFGVDVGDWTARKLAALRCHRTQAGAQSSFAWLDAADARRWLGVELFRRAPLAGRARDVLERLVESAARP